MHNPFVHVELATTDVDKAKAFYGKLFDWKLEDTPMEEGTYTVINVGEDGTGGGIMKHPMPGAPSAWTPYVNVDDVAAETKKAESLGGHVVVPPKDIGIGIFSVVIDPTGAPIGFWKTLQPPK